MATKKADTEKVESAEKQEKAAKATKTTKTAKTVKTEKAEKVEKVEKVEKTEATEAAKASKAKKTVKTEKVYKSRVQEHYEKEVVPALIKQFGYKNPMQVPKLVKIVVSSGLGDIKDNAKSIQIAQNEMKLITGQQPVLRKAKKSVANFKVREGMTIGLKVTLRGKMMFDFYDKFVSIALPRVRDFRGLSADSFDGKGNYCTGMKEQLIFPEIQYDQVEKIRGMDICFVTTAKTDEEARELLRAMGLPFKR